MKKALVLGMILLALGTFAYADGGATVGMDFGRTQFTVVSGNSAANSPITQAWGPGTAGFPQGERIDFQFAWSNQYTGINSTYYIGTGAVGGQPPINVVNLYGTLKFVPDLFTAYIGEFQGDGWDHFRLDSSHPIHDVNNNNVGRFSGWGLILDVMPKDTGFDAAVFAKTQDPSKTQTIQQSLANYAVAASYTVPSMVTVIAGTNTFSVFDPTVGGPTQRNIFASVQLLMIPNLTLWDEFYYAGFDYNPSVTIYSDELAGQYVMDKLTIVLAAFFGGNSGGKATKGVFGFGPSTPDYARSGNGGADYTVWAVDPEVYYNAGMVTVGLYGMVGGLSTTNYGINYVVEPYVKLNNFGVRVSFAYSGNSQSGSISTWEVPIIVDWGF